MSLTENTEQAKMFRNFELHVFYLAVLPIFIKIKISVGMLCGAEVSTPCFQNQSSTYLCITRIISKNWDISLDIQRQSSAPELCLGRTLEYWPKESLTHLALTGTHNR